MLILLIVACNSQKSDTGQTENETAVKNLRSDEAKKLLSENKDIIIIDVRTPQEFNAGHIKDAKNINVADKNFNSRIEGLDRDSTYLVYCRTGNRSRYAIQFMEEQNFKSLYHLEHGITEWVGSGNPVEQ